MGPRRAVAVGHNGNLVNTQQLLEQLPGGRTRLVGTSDTDLLTALLANEPGEDTVEALANLLPRVKGAYALVVMDETRVIGVRDPFGLRPLVLGMLPTADGPAWCLASETAALDVLGAEFVRDVAPGEMVVLGEPGGLRSVRFAEGHEQLCVFELIYFARPDSYMLGRNLYEARRRMGEALAREAPADADLVMPVPDTGAPAAAGYAEQSGHPVPRGHGPQSLCRADLHPAQPGPPPARRDGQAVGAARAGPWQAARSSSTIRSCAARRRARSSACCGAPARARSTCASAHRRSSIRASTASTRRSRPSSSQSTKSIDEIREFVDADSLSYLSIGGVLEAIDLPRERFCFACFDGRYPVPVPYDVANHKLLLERETLVSRGMSHVAQRLRRRRRRCRGRRPRGRAAARAPAACPTDLLGVGGFGAAVELPAGYLRPVLVSATDGVGTKTDIARRLGRHRRAGPGSCGDVRR